MYKVRQKVELITQNTILVAEDFSGWQCINQGDTVATVNGVVLDPSGSVIGLDYTNLDPSVIWDESIKIIFSGTGTDPKIVITRLKYTFNGGL